MEKTSEFICSVHPDTFLTDVHEKSLEGTERCIDMDSLIEGFAGTLWLFDSLTAGEIYKTEFASFSLFEDMKSDDAMPPRRPFIDLC